MRHIIQPGPPEPERVQWVEARGRAFSFTLEAGLPLLEAARRGFAAEGFVGGTLNIGAGALGPFAYVMPALSRTRRLASRGRRARGGASPSVTAAAATVSSNSTAAVSTLSGHGTISTWCSRPRSQPSMAR